MLKPILGVLILSLPMTSLLAFECSEEMNELECLIFLETNRVREEQGRKPLAISPECTEAAIYHTDSMVESGKYGHEIKGYKSFKDRMDDFKVPGMRFAENIHHVPVSKESSLEKAAIRIVNDWYESKGHRKNMMNREFKSIGIAAYGDYQVQCFSDYLPQGVEEPKAAPKKGTGFIKNIFGRFKRD